MYSISFGGDPVKLNSAVLELTTNYVDAYKLDGTFLWRVDLGWNLESGTDEHSGSDGVHIKKWLYESCSTSIWSAIGEKSW